MRSVTLMQLYQMENKRHLKPLLVPCTAYRFALNVFALPEPIIAPCLSSYVLFWIYCRLHEQLLVESRYVGRFQHPFSRVSLAREIRACPIPYTSATGTQSAAPELIVWPAGPSPTRRRRRTSKWCRRRPPAPGSAIAPRALSALSGRGRPTNAACANNVHQETMQPGQ